LLAAHTGRGGVAAAVYLTAVGAARMREAERARSWLGIDQAFELGLPEGNMAVGEPAARRLLDLLETIRPELICVPAFEDVHPDHRGAHRLLALALRLAGEVWPLSILTYEGFTPVSTADCWVDITATAETKWRALACFESQERLYRLGDVCRSLNRYRGLTSMRRAVMFAEAFRSFTVTSYLGDKRLQSS
jgi:LmbE family N-acetylglucosaminyl deacetylase